MNASPGNPLWEAHIQRLQHMHGGKPRTAAHARGLRTFISELEAEEAQRGEWTAAPSGRLGRRLLADVEPYLEFFAIARAA